MNQVIRNTLVGTLTVIRLGFDLLREGLALLASVPESTLGQDALSSAVRGGELNYRTGELDDGTDAAGWYERD
ncbi:hypothetical protein [Congregibacter litoralis]|uniref:Uncharacterized protein n=1 Tax=Congregibacter litoralis KT71 TaxID=314285 RepID=A4AE53_9GAMM|nr:hypothetical protein [Congregibacter litoralis]EAQ95745.1 hypothetical protein KT71_13954 [Congregibacter litoralis KT71]